MLKTVVILIAAGMVAMAVPVSAAEPQGADEKELCLLLARDCADKLFGLQEKIKGLQHEIARGRTVYRSEELRALKKKLEEAEEMLYKLTPRPLPENFPK